jgi:outer membrane cobalamin receptor
MKPIPTRTGLSLAIAALLAAPGAFAQDPAPIPPTEPAATGSDDGDQAERATELGAVEVRGKYIPEPLLESSEVISVVTREDFARQGDSDAAEALTRVAGLSLAEGKFIYVRGLNERYSSALLNGSPLPSPEPLKRVVPLDLFPANVLETVHVQKTYSARYPGEFGGGVIDLRTVGTPDIPFLTLSVGTGGNSETTFRDGLTYYGSDSDWFGYDDGTRKIPAELRAAMETGRRIDQGSFTQDELKRIGASFVNAPLNLLQAKDSIDPDFSIDGSAGRSFQLGDGLELGLLAVARNS